MSATPSAPPVPPAGEDKLTAAQSRGSVQMADLATSPSDAIARLTTCDLLDLSGSSDHHSDHHSDLSPAATPTASSFIALPIEPRSTEDAGFPEAEVSPESQRMQFEVKEARKRADLGKKSMNALYGLMLLCYGSAHDMLEEMIARSEIHDEVVVVMTTLYLMATLESVWARKRAKLSCQEITARTSTVHDEAGDRAGLTELSSLSLSKAAAATAARSQHEGHLLRLHYDSLVSADWAPVPEAGVLEEANIAELIGGFILDQKRDEDMLKQREEDRNKASQLWRGGKLGPPSPASPAPTPPAPAPAAPAQAEASKPAAGPPNPKPDPPQTPPRLRDLKLYTQCPFRYSAHCCFQGDPGYDAARLKEVHHRGKAAAPPASASLSYAYGERKGRLHRLQSRFRRSQPQCRRYAEFTRPVPLQVARILGAAPPRGSGGSGGANPAPPCSADAAGGAPPRVHDPYALPRGSGVVAVAAATAADGAATQEGCVFDLAFDISAEAVGSYLACLKHGCAVRFGNQCASGVLRNTRAFVVGVSHGLLWVLPWSCGDAHPVLQPPRRGDVAEVAVPVCADASRPREAPSPASVGQVFDMWKVDEKFCIKNCGAQIDCPVFDSGAHPRMNRARRALENGGGGDGGVAIAGGGPTPSKADPVAALDTAIDAEVRLHFGEGFVPQPPPDSGLLPKPTAEQAAALLRRVSQRHGAAGGEAPSWLMPQQPSP